MELFDVIIIDTYRCIIRVPGGWIYDYSQRIDGEISITSSFIPFNDEFDPKKHDVLR